MKEPRRIPVDGITYTVIPKEDHSYAILIKGEEILRIYPKAGKDLIFKWQTKDGRTSALIDKIGIIIETQGLRAI
jgi:hypothetical protein